MHAHRVRYVNDTSVCAAACRTCFCDPSLAYVEGNTVTYASLQVLYYFGCKRVYLVRARQMFVRMRGGDAHTFAPRLPLSCSTSSGGR